MGARGENLFLEKWHRNSLEAQIFLAVPLLSESLTQYLYDQNRETSPMVLLDKIILAPCNLMAQIYMTYNFVRQRHVSY